MKHCYTLLVALALSTFSTAQLVPYQAPAEKDVAVKRSLNRMTGHEVIPQTPRADRPTGQISGVQNRADIAETTIGNTQYDLQSNGSIQNRFINLGEGNMHAGWTQSLQTSPFNDRGTGYNESEAMFFDDIPFDRLETIRVGWPSIDRTADGRVFAIAHPGFTDLSFTYKDAGGTWQESLIETETSMGMLWPRAMAGGPDGNSIHCFALTTPIANQTTTTDEYEGLDGALLYYRSLDGGDTWETTDLLLPEVDSTQFLGFDGDSYSIFVRDSKVAFASFNDYADSFVLLSEDNGETWTKRTLVDFPVDLFPVDVELLDLDGDLVADTVLSTDNSGAVHISPDGKTHVLWGNMRYLDDVLGDGNNSYFPFTDGLEYWNEDMEDATSTTIAVTQDLDDDGEIIFADDIGTYFVSLTGLPNMGSDVDGNLYVSYSGVVETHATGTQNYRHIFLTKSEDGGTSWTDVVDATPDEEYIGYEAVFATMAPLVDDRIHLIYQRDEEPGLHVRGDLDAVDLNDIVYLWATTDLDNTIVPTVNEFDADWNFEVYPNPTSGEFYVYLPEVNEGFVRVMDLSGQLVAENNRVNGLVRMELNDLPAGMYLVEAGNDIQHQTRRLMIK